MANDDDVCDSISAVVILSTCTSYFYAVPLAPRPHVGCGVLRRPASCCGKTTQYAARHRNATRPV